MLVGVRKRRLTLAVELCADALADERVCRSIDEVEAAETRFSMYEDQPAFSARERHSALQRQKELYGVFGELTLPVSTGSAEAISWTRCRDLREARAERVSCCSLTAWIRCAARGKKGGAGIRSAAAHTMWSPRFYRPSELSGSW